MKEFYKDYTKELLKVIVTAFRNNDKETAKKYTNELKELNKTIFLDKQMVR